MIRNILISMTLAVMVACTSAMPYDVPPAERAAMEQRVAQFSSDFRNGRTERIVDVVPPKVTAALAARAGVTEERLRAGVIAETRAATRAVKILSYGMATDRAEWRQTTAGRPYALIPTQTVVQAPDGTKLQSNNTTLAFADGGIWYLVRIDDANQRSLLTEAYPEFGSLRVSPGTTKLIG